ncbi:hypothetical protein PR202_gb20877 [Eleusine coracana subsp. coracana]|uniref:Uncharacterized protein n=1 Tax=Eleusine coracana subsp. coracana TaxID=191504 RepID=A0AAV5FDN9_ELECO|nr:hypothetical protein PR202_gb20877 [Eleusine coracana subsp. coracana]
MCHIQRKFTIGTPRFRLLPETLSPPALTSDDDDAAAEYPRWVLLESLAYVAKRDNGTTAFSRTSDGKEIQVTVCPRRPPSVSYLCVYSPDAEIPVESKILAMEEDLVLLLITVSCQRDVMKNIDYYVYRAADRAAGGKPSLTLLKRPPAPYISFYAEHTGILHCGNSHHRPQLGSESGISLRPHVQVAESSYIIAALKTVPWEMQNEFEFPQGSFILSLYHSKKDAWTVTI